MSMLALTLPGMPRKPMPPSEKKLPIASRIEPALMNALVALAEADDRKLAYMVEKAIREYVERHGKPKPPAPRK